MALLGLFFILKASIQVLVQHFIIIEHLYFVFILFSYQLVFMGNWGTMENGITKCWNADDTSKNILLQLDKRVGQDKLHNVLYTFYDLCSYSDSQKP